MADFLTLKIILIVLRLNVFNVKGSYDYGN